MSQPMNQTEAMLAAADMLAGFLGEPPESSGPLTFSGALLRLVPLAGIIFVTFFGNKIATVVRVGSVRSHITTEPIFHC